MVKQLVLVLMTAMVGCNSNEGGVDKSVNALRRSSDPAAQPREIVLTFGDGSEFGTTNLSNTTTTNYPPSYLAGPEITALRML